jgi:hypothetical protein
VSTGSVDPAPPSTEPPLLEPGRKADGTFAPGHTFGKPYEFQKGGDPANGGGVKRALSVRQLEEKARGRCESVFLVWETILLDAKKADRDRIRAGELLAAYGMGRPRQAITVSGEEGKPPVQLDAVSALLERMIAVGAAAVPGSSSTAPPITVEGRLLEASPTPAAAEPRDQAVADEARTSR